MEQQLKGRTEQVNEVEKAAKPYSTIISANGVKIESKLNPAAKEFYPAHLLQRYACNKQPSASPPPAQEQIVQLYMGKASMGGLATAKLPPLGGKPSGQAEIVKLAAKEATEQQDVGEQQNKQPTEVTVKETVKVAAMAAQQELVAVTGNSSAKVQAAIEKVKVASQLSAEQIKEAQIEVKEEQECNVAGVEQQTANGEKGKCAEKVTEGEQHVPEEANECRQVVALEEPPHQQLPVVPVESHVPHIEAVTVENESVGDVRVASVAGTTGELAETLDPGDNGQQKNDNEANFIMHINEISHSQTKIEFDTDYKVPPSTPTEEYCDNVDESQQISARIGELHTTEDKKQTERKFGFKKLSRIAVGASSKCLGTCGDKSATKGGTIMSRTKRISESLHNLSSSLKSKTDLKKSEGGTRLLPRSSTTIPRSTIRSRTLLAANKTVVDCNGSSGLSKESTKLSVKDAVSLRSTSSTEQSISSKSSVQSSSRKTVSNNSGKIADKPCSTLATKSKELLPRGTLASTLRQNEAQKCLPCHAAPKSVPQ